METTHVLRINDRQRSLIISALGKEQITKREIMLRANANGRISLADIFQKELAEIEDLAYLFFDTEEIPEEDPDQVPEPVELPASMTQQKAIRDCLLQIASVSGDLYILYNHKGEMSTDLREKMEEITQQLDDFNRNFCFEY